MMRDLVSLTHFILDNKQKIRKFKQPTFLIKCNESFLVVFLPMHQGNKWLEVGEI